MKVWVVTLVAYVMEVMTTPEKAEEYCRTEGGRYEDPTGHRFQDGDNDRRVHQYRSGVTGRWNNSGYVITETEVTE